MPGARWIGGGAMMRAGLLALPIAWVGGAHDWGLALFCVELGLVGLWIRGWRARALRRGTFRERVETF